MSSDLERIAAEPGSAKDSQVAKLEGDLQDEKDYRLQEKFVWILVLLIVADMGAFGHLGGGGIFVVFVFELILLLVMARICAVNGIHTLIQNALDYATRGRPRG